MEKFETLLDYINELRSSYYKALSAFYAYEALRESKAIDVQGRSEAGANVAVLNAYKNFFIPTEWSFKKVV